MKKRIYNEAKIEHTRKFVRAYGELAGQIGQIEDLQYQIVRAYKSATSTVPTFTSVGSIVSDSKSKYEPVARKAAWITSHRTGFRSMCVGNFVAQERGGAFSSPLLEQLQRLGFDPRPVDLGAFYSMIQEREMKWDRRIDSVVFDAENRRFIVVKGCSVGGTKNLRTKSGDSQEPNLWVPKVTRANRRQLQSSKLVPLTYAQWLLQTAFPSYDVETVALVVDPEPAAWSHEAYRLTNTALAELTDKWLPVCNRELLWHGEACGQGSAGVDGLDEVPMIVASEQLNRLPVDRATRCRMVLDFMWRKQASNESLTTSTVSDITDGVSERHLIWYTEDWRRHDLEDCLEKGGFIERPKFERKCYALTSLGVFEAMISRQQLKDPGTVSPDQDVASYVLSAINRQARLWTRYWNGEQVIA